MNKLFMIFIVLAFAMTTSINATQEEKSLAPFMMQAINKRDYSNFHGLYTGAQNFNTYKKKLSDFSQAKLDIAQQKMNINQGAINPEKMLKGFWFVGMGLAISHLVLSKETDIAVACGAATLLTFGVHDLVDGYYYQEYLKYQYEQAKQLHDQAFATQN